ncbi:Ferredoxin [Olavius sp. associated proteobacterium Delta 1]|nr:Ferredoxin [Olavius sp. associated proteobacterium Delta 1]
MSEKENNWSRRRFLKATGTAGLGALMTPTSRLATAAETQATVPTRPFGKTGVDVSILSLGGMFNIASNQLMMKQALRWGVTYWDTADCYQRGSEKGIGKYFKKYPADRSKVFLVSKSDARDPDGMTDLLDRSLKRMNTDYIDLYFVHSIYGIDELDQSTRTWAEKAKAAGKIRFFGFSTHRNMEQCMREGAKLGWIDGIMMTYNFRLMHTGAMKRAVDACVKAGIGLTAMKTQGGGSVRTDTDTELNLAGRFMQKGFTDAQAKLMAVWRNPNIASICSQMPNMSILMANTAAAMDRTKLSSTGRKLLQQYARETHSDYCTGCTEICESAIKEKVPIGDVMRYLMYCRSYGDRHYASAEFKKIPQKIRDGLTGVDYSSAEKKCPQKMAIAKLMQEAADELS